MENKEQRRVLIIIGVIIAIIAILAYVLSIFYSSSPLEVDPNTSGQDETPNQTTDVFQDELVRLEDESLFFGVQKVINDYYNSIFEEDTSRLLSILDPFYIEENQIISSNLYSVIGSDYGVTSYVAKEIYYNPDSTVTYYFVRGDLSCNSVMGNNYEYIQDISFLIIVDESNQHYILRPIDSSDILEYALDYSLEERDIDSEGIFDEIEISLENKLSNYLAIFINFLIYQPEEAYSLLTDETKDSYSTYEDFQSQVITLYQEFSSKVFSYSSEEIDETTVYYVVDDNQNKFTIYEYYIMDFQISY